MSQVSLDGVRAKLARAEALIAELRLHVDPIVKAVNGSIVCEPHDDGTRLVYRLFTAPTVEEWDAAWNKDGEKYTHGTFAPTYTSNTHMFNWLGWPALSIPVGFVDGMPVGLQLITKPNREAQLYPARELACRLAGADADLLRRKPG